eukprot:5539523-Amphidinium_carterae.1
MEQNQNWLRWKNWLWWAKKFSHKGQLELLEKKVVIAFITDKLTHREPCLPVEGLESHSIENVSWKTFCAKKIPSPLSNMLHPETYLTHSLKMLYGSITQLDCVAKKLEHATSESTQTGTHAQNNRTVVRRVFLSILRKKVSGSHPP